VTHPGDDGREMPHGPSFDDDAIDAILAGNARDGEDASLASFVEDVRSNSSALPIPSAALAAALASGISPTPTSPPSQWRKAKMKIQGFLAGLSVAGKIALGAGIAAAATTGAGAAGVLPGPVQHAFSNAVGAVTPFEVPGGGHGGSEHDVVEPVHTSTTTTTLGDGETPTTEQHESEHDADHPTPTTLAEHHDGEHHETPTTALTPTTEHHGDNSDGNATGRGDCKNSDGGDGNNSDGHNTDGHDGDHHGDTTTTIPTSPTTEHHGDNHDGDNNNPESLTLGCERGREPNHVTCTWSASTSDQHHLYALLRTDGEHSKTVFTSEDGLSFTDTDVASGHSYSYRVVSLRSDESVESHSPLVTLVCCGD